MARIAIVTGWYLASHGLPAGWRVLAHDPALERTTITTEDDAAPNPQDYPRDAPVLRRVAELKPGYAPEWAKPLDTRMP